MDENPDIAVVRNNLRQKLLTLLVDDSSYDGVPMPSTPRDIDMSQMFVNFIPANGLRLLNNCVFSDSPAPTFDWHKTIVENYELEIGVHGDGVIDYLVKDKTQTGNDRHITYGEIPFDGNHLPSVIQNLFDLYLEVPR